jgi:hypothetical protein
MHTSRIRASSIFQISFGTRIDAVSGRTFHIAVAPCGGVFVMDNLSSAEFSELKIADALGDHIIGDRAQLTSAYETSIAFSGQTHRVQE